MMLGPTTEHSRSLVGVVANGGRNILEEPVWVQVIVAIVILFCFCFVVPGLNNNAQDEQQLEGVRNSLRRNDGDEEQPGTDERKEQFLQTFYFQTVLPDRSNITAESIRQESQQQVVAEQEEQGKNNKEKGDNNDDDDGSVIILEGGGKNNNRKPSMSLRNVMASWRRPSPKDGCAICLEDYNAGETICVPITKSCNHVFHDQCIMEWLKNRDRCPMCRVNLLPSETETEA
mmetsp:Transcript_44167/g.106424  ORF Transcript_44167/g.106424 Transcript_44167/m.106424 type:complete len:231 (-) Transcript_44167:243-935(-)